METQGIVIWAQSGTKSLIVWCADCGALAYVADRRLEGDRHEALCIGDFVDVRIEARGAMRIGRDLRFRAGKARSVVSELGRVAEAGAVMSPQRRIAGSFAFGLDALRAAGLDAPANRRAKRGTGAA